MNNEIVDLAQHGIRGANHYWAKKDEFKITTQELQAVGVEDNTAYINKALVPVLQSVNDTLRAHGVGIIVKDGYRSPALYKLVQQKRYELYGEEHTDLTLNTETMPHASGYVLDVTLYDLTTDKELELWDKKDWPDGIFIDFYRHKSDSKSKKFQERQDLLIQTMLAHGFGLGSKKEIWHFEFIKQ